jgi:glycosyltransferase involved in cell wall biosynthesis
MNQSSDLPGGIICFGGGDWWYHSRAHSDFQLMLRLARQRPVLLVNSIGLRTPRLGRTPRFWRRVYRKARSIMRFLRRPLAELPQFYVLSPVMLPFYGSPRLRRINYRLIRWQVKLAAWHVGIADPTIVVTPPTAWEVAKPMQRRALLYNRSDKHSEFHEANRTYLAALEEELIRAADAVLYASQVLQDEERHLTAGRGHLLGHGVDLELFHDRWPEPADMARIPRPRIGFFGGLRAHLVDFALLEKIARELPRAQLVLVGDAPSHIDALTRLANVHWLGQKNHADVPAYGAAFDVAILPYRQNEWIRNCNPIKLREYLAIGLPVVSVDFPEAHRYRDSIRIAAGPDEFVSCLRALLAAPGSLACRQARRAGVAHASWQKLADRVLQIATDAGERRLVHA